MSLLGIFNPNTSSKKVGRKVAYDPEYSQLIFSRKDLEPLDTKPLPKAADFNGNKNPERTRRTKVKHPAVHDKFRYARKIAINKAKPKPVPEGAMRSYYEPGEYKEEHEPIGKESIDE